ncbi:hypothetical protein ABID65_008810 [Bradyrhizobium sp. S3.9.2]|uniref:hypothetical protein n=1 Tax=Bradyrhizobium sp. S3.9.2 TaxID=3156432 RepID=UPI0033980E4E
MKRRRTKQTTSLEERVLHQAEQIRLLADSMRAGKEREQLLKKARDADMGAHIEGWLRSPGLQPPK